MSDKELKEIRQKISCPQFNDDHYGEWGILTLHQRRTIKRMVEYIDTQEQYIEKLNLENKNLLMHLECKDAKIERLKDKIEKDKKIHTSIGFEMCQKAKAEAYKEFAERLKKQMYQSSDWSHGEHPFVVEESDIDNTLDELVGE